MRPGRCPYVADNDELLLGSHLLFALEHGHMPMHAEDFQAIADAASDAMRVLTTSELVRVRNHGPSSLQSLAENALHARGIVDWMSEREAHVAAVAVWRALRHRLATSSAS